MLISELEMSSAPSNLQGRTYGSIYALDSALSMLHLHCRPRLG